MVQNGLIFKLKKTIISHDIFCCPYVYHQATFSYSSLDHFHLIPNSDSSLQSVIVTTYNNLQIQLLQTVIQTGLKSFSKLLTKACNKIQRNKFIVVKYLEST